MNLATIVNFIIELILACPVELSLTIATVTYVWVIVATAKWISRHEEWIPEMDDDGTDS